MRINKYSSVSRKERIKRLKEVLKGWSSESISKQNYKKQLKDLENETSRKKENSTSPC